MVFNNLIFFLIDMSGKMNLWQVGMAVVMSTFFLNPIICNEIGDAVPFNNLSMITIDTDASNYEEEEIRSESSSDGTTCKNFSK